jgi:alpha-tubulin suppressor-like RCC1 family protein
MFNFKLTGANEFGQLGDGTEESAKEPKKVNALETEFVKSVSCGAHCTTAIAETRENDGTISKSRLWVWGQNQVYLNILLNLFFAD